VVNADQSPEHPALPDADAERWAARAAAFLQHPQAFQEEQDSLAAVPSVASPYASAAQQEPMLVVRAWKFPLRALLQQEQPRLELWEQLALHSALPPLEWQERCPRSLGALRELVLRRAVCPPPGVKESSTQSPE